MSLNAAISMICTNPFLFYDISQNKQYYLPLFLFQKRLFNIVFSMQFLKHRFDYVKFSPA